MKKLIQIVFCLLVSFSAFAQEVKDTLKIKESKWSINITGGTNITSVHNSGRDENKKRKLNEFYGIASNYSINPNLKLSLGVLYHHFTYDTDDDLKMILIPVYFMLTTNEEKKLCFRLFSGPEFGLVADIKGTSYYKYTGGYLFFAALVQILIIQSVKNFHLILALLIQIKLSHLSKLSEGLLTLL